MKNFIMSGAVLFFVFGCGPLKKKDDMESQLDLSKLPGYWSLSKVTVSGETQLFGTNLMDISNRRMLIFKDGKLTSYNITSKSYTDAKCLKDADYSIKENRVVLPERNNGDCRPWAYGIFDLNDKQLVINGWITKDQKHYESLNYFDRIAESEGLALIQNSSPTVSVNVPR